MWKTLDEAKAAVAEGWGVTFVVWNGYAFEGRVIPRSGFGGCLIGKREAVAQAIKDHPGLRVGMVAYTD